MDIEVGGQIQGVSLGSFLQIVHMDRTSCTLKVSSGDDLVGYLFIVDGALIAAEADGVDGVEAAYEVLSWNKIKIVIDGAVAPKKNIDAPLMNVLMEGLRRKDEKNAQGIGDGLDDARTELEVEFDPDSYVSKDDEIASQFVAGESNADDGGIELDYDNAPPPLAEKKEPQQSEEPLAKKEPPSEAFQKFEEPEHDAPKSEDQPVEESSIEEDVEFEGEDALLPERTVAGITKKLIIIAIILSAVTFGALQFYKVGLLKKDYDSIIAKVQQQNDSVKMQQLLYSFINSRDDDDRYLLKAVDLMNDIESLSRTEKRIAALPKDDNYKTAVAGLYKDFFKETDNTVFKDYVGRKTKQVSMMLEKRDFKKLGVIITMSREIRMKAYEDFLTKYPVSRHKQAVKNMIAAVGDEVYVELKKEIKICDKNNSWELCIQLIDKFINTFGEDNRLDEMRTIRQKMQDKSEYADLKFRANAVDYAIARAMFVKYLKKSENTALKKEARFEISQLNRKIDFKEKWTETYSYCTNKEVLLSQRLRELEGYIERDYSGLFKEESGSLLEKLKFEEKQKNIKQYKLLKKRTERLRLEKLQAEKDRVAKEKEDTRLAELKKQQHEKRLKEESERMTLQLDKTTGRFTVNPDRTVTDKDTGKTWSIIDSSVEVGECMTFQQSKDFVENLRTGGYRDWRLPDTSELAVIYNRKPYFPASGAEWYWTSEATDEAMMGGGKAVIFYPDKKDVFKKIYLKFSNCGFVHAVRP